MIFDALEFYGLEKDLSEAGFYKTEDIQIAIVQKNENSERKNFNLPLFDVVPEAFKKFEDYAKSYDQYKNIIHSYLKEYFSNEGKIAIFGVAPFSMNGAAMSSVVSKVSLANRPVFSGVAFS